MSHLVAISRVSRIASELARLWPRRPVWCGCGCKCQPGSVLSISDRASAYSIMTFHEWLPIQRYIQNEVYLGGAGSECRRGYLPPLTMRRRPPKWIFTCRHLRSIVRPAMSTPKESSFGRSRSREKFLHHRQRRY